MRLLTVILLFFFNQINAQDYFNYEQDKLRAIQIHNKARKKVKVNKLQWSDELANQAQYYADYLAKRNKGLVHSKSLSSINQGENLYMAKGYLVDS